MLLVAPTMYYAMAPSATMKFSADKKSIILPSMGGSGWTWTDTMTAVR